MKDVEVHGYLIRYCNYEMRRLDGFLHVVWFTCMCIVDGDDCSNLFLFDRWKLDLV